VYDSSFLCRFSLDLFVFQFILVLSRKDELGKENTHEKVNYHHHRTNYDAIHRTKSGCGSTARDRRKTPKTAITIKVEQVPDEDEKTAETAFVGEVSGDKSVTEAPKEEASVFQETVTEECTEVSETIIIEME